MSKQLFFPAPALSPTGLLWVSRPLETLLMLFVLQPSDWSAHTGKQDGNQCEFGFCVFSTWIHSSPADPVVTAVLEV